MRWFKCHINITWTIFWLLQLVSLMFESIVPFFILYPLFIIATIWSLQQKGRSWFWVLIPISVLFLYNVRSK